MTYKEGKKCKKVPHKSCHYEKIPRCSKVAVEKCEDEIVDKCKETPVKQGNKVAKKRCVWPERSMKDDTRC